MPRVPIAEHTAHDKETPKTDPRPATKKLAVSSPDAGSKTDGDVRAMTVKALFARYRRAADAAANDL